MYKCMLLVFFAHDNELSMVAMFKVRSTAFNLFTESHFESLNTACWHIRQINDPNRTWHPGTPQAA